MQQDEPGLTRRQVAELTGDPMTREQVIQAWRDARRMREYDTAATLVLLERVKLMARRQATNGERT